MFSGSRQFAVGAISNGFQHGKDRLRDGPMETKTVSAHTKGMKKRAAGALCLVAIALMIAAWPSKSLAQILPTGSPVPGDPPKTNALPVNQGILARNLIGSRVQSNRGDDLGFVSDLLIDPGSGRLEYVVISTGGFIKLGRKLRPIPPDLLGTATAMRGVVEADIGSELWKTAPTFARPALADIGDDASRRQIYAYYHQKWPGSEIRADRKAAAKSHHHSDDPHRLDFGSHFFGKVLLDRGGRNIARITDILLDPRSPQITFAVIRLGTASQASAAQPVRQQFAVPVNVLTETSAGEKRFTVAVPADQFQQAQPLNAQDWAKISSPNAPLIYKFRSDESSGSAPASGSTRQ
jgi:sporulation protein YlmC with PRC-barrel domain